MKTMKNKIKTTLLALGLLLLTGCANVHLFERWDYVNNRPVTGPVLSNTKTGVTSQSFTVISNGQARSYQVITPVR
jgi:hypothetical protein